MSKKRFMGFVILSLLSLSAHSIGLTVTGNSCDNITLTASSIYTAGSYFSSYRDCSARISIAGIDQNTTWTLKAKISAVDTSLPVKIAINGGGFQYLNTSTEITLTSGTGTTSSDLPVTIRIDHIDARDGYGSIINHANILYRVITN
jgi:hypothetical protein